MSGLCELGIGRSFTFSISSVLKLPAVLLSITAGLPQSKELCNYMHLIKDVSNFIDFISIAKYYFTINIDLQVFQRLFFAILQSTAAVEMKLILRRNIKNCCSRFCYHTNLYSY